MELARRVMDEQARAAIPRTEQARPSRLRPAGVRDIPVQIGGPQIEPEAARGAVPESVARVCMQHHLGHAGGARSEVDESRFVGSGLEAIDRFRLRDQAIDKSLAKFNDECIKRI